MAAKTSRRSTSVTSIRSRSPQVSTSTHRERSRSPLSPTRLSRIQEKEELQNLNDRLATYIDTVRNLENENNRLNILIKSSQETVTREVTSIKNVYEKELSDVRSALDDTAKEKAKLQMIADKLRKEVDELSSKLSKKEKDFLAADKLSKSLDIHNQDLQRRLSQALAENKKLENELNEAESERDKFAQQLNNVKKNLESETLLRVDIENRLQSLKEELQFKESVHKQEVTEIRRLKETEVTELNSQLKENYEQKLSDTLRELREQYETQMRINRDEIETIYETKIADLQDKYDRANSSYTNYRDESRNMKTKIDSLTSKLSSLENQNSALQYRIKDLEKMLEQERDWHNEALKAKDEELKNLREEMSQHLQDYHDLLDIKTALDLEIAAYRKLLEGEEIRLNMSPAGSRSGSPSPSSISTPVRSVKRRRTVVSDTERSSSGTQASGKALGDIEISDQDLNGKFIKLHNKGNREINVGGWQIVQTADNREIKYKFHRSALLKPKATLVVWSSDSGVTHSPPQNYVMKNQAWTAASSMETVLLDNHGKEAAIRESSRTSESSEHHRIEEH